MVSFKDAIKRIPYCKNVVYTGTPVKIKKRDFSKPINVLISDLQMLYTLVEDISIEEKKLVNAFWPGDLTLIFNKKK